MLNVGHFSGTGWPLIFVFVCLFVCLFFLGFRDRVSLCSPSCPGIHSVDQAGLKLKNLLVSDSQLLGLKACATTAPFGWILKRVTTAVCGST